MKDYCTLFPDIWRGKFIGDCCKAHDNLCGERGSYNLFKTVKPFFDCLRRKRVKIVYATMIVLGATVICFTYYPYLVYKKYMYRKNNER